MEDRQQNITAASPPESQSITLEVQDLVVSVDAFFGLHEQEIIKEER